MHLSITDALPISDALVVHLSISDALVDKWCTCRLVFPLSISYALVD